MVRLPVERRRAERPHGPHSGPRRPWRRAVAQAFAACNRLLDRLPALHRHVQGAIRCTHDEVALRRGGRGLDGVRLAFLSDLHAGSCMREADLCRIFAQVAAEQPDLVLLGGDLINTREREITFYREALRLLRPPLGVYAVPGNHDHFFGTDIELWRLFLRDHGVRVLLDAGERVTRGGASLWLAGVDDLTEAGSDLEAALAGAAEGEPIVLLSHHPDFFVEASGAGVDLQLSGHTHGGQIRIFGWAPLTHSAHGYVEGFHERNGARLFVGRGVGVTLLPLRVGAPAQIAFLTLRVP
ncbi:MAG: metallophosphoesterase [Planctomycetes bacterium]|nr:metallophosphoesterase [Planctomycetota bacterium]